MGSIALIRSLVSKEGDHERGIYTLKSGFRPDPTRAPPRPLISDTLRTDCV
jgi:hypothetical protein